MYKNLGKCRHKKQSFFPTKSPSECKFVPSFFSNFMFLKLRDVTAIDFSTSLYILIMKMT